MAFDNLKNFAYSSVAIAPSPATSGISLTLATGDGAAFPAAPFQLAIWPAGVIPRASNAEIVRCTAINGDVLTITRAQESSIARAVVVGDQIAVVFTAKQLTDIQSLLDGGLRFGSNSNTTPVGNITQLGKGVAFMEDGSIWIKTSAPSNNTDWIPIKQ